ncbi:MAG: hypothetical protein V3U15_00285, partial [Nitrospinota bacterium]
VTPASEHDASAASFSFKGEDLNEIRNAVNTLVEENKKIKKFCFQLKKRLIMLEEKLNQSES